MALGRMGLSWDQKQADWRLLEDPPDHEIVSVPRYFGSQQGGSIRYFDIQISHSETALLVLFHINRLSFGLKLKAVDSDPRSSHVDNLFPNPLSGHGQLVIYKDLLFSIYTLLPY